MKKQSLFSLFCACAILMGSNIKLHAQCNTNDPSIPAGIVPGYVEGNPALCPGGIKIDPVISGTYPIDNFGNTITIVVTNGPCGQLVSWTSSANIAMETIVVKGGNSANTYQYAPGTSSDGALHSPVNSSGKYADLSHVDFCFHYTLELSTTARTTYSRTYDWCLEESCDGPSSLTLSTGQVYMYPFSWTAFVCGENDSDWNVLGTITVKNNTPYPATLTGLDLGFTEGQTPILDCGIQFPFVLQPGNELLCSFDADMANGNGGSYTATVVTSTPKVQGKQVMGGYAFGNPSTLMDACTMVNDNCGTSTQVCVAQAPMTKSYTCPVGGLEECGEFQYQGISQMMTSDLNIPGVSDCTIEENVICDGSCTLTPGYWKTHSSYGPAPYDATWANIGENTVFFLSGKSYYQVLWTPPAGNVYYNLSRAYIAAKLNILNGATVPQNVQAAYDAATAIFTAYTPTQVGAFKGANRNQVISLASTLDSYNNGLIGPGHCSEEASSNQPLNISNAQAQQVAQITGSLVSASPNPFGEELNLTFSIPYNSQASLQLLDASGRVIETLFAGNMEANTPERARMDTGQLQNGVYFYRLVTDQQVIAGQVIALK